MTETTQARPVADPTIGSRVCGVPCGWCPFLTKFDGPDDKRPFLRPSRRAEFIASMLTGADFVCHQTAEVDEDDEEATGDYVRVADSLSCAGARLVLERADMSSNMMRFEERFGDYDRDAFLVRNAKVKVWTYDEIFDEVGEACSVVGPGCEAPAGHLIGGQAVRGTVSADHECSGCGESVCGECMNEDGVCNHCEESDW